MSGNLDLLLAFVAGLLSFLSPCILPLIPSFLSFIGGISYPDLKENRAPRAWIFLQTLLFVTGFSAVFIALGILFSSSVGLLGSAVQIVNIAAGSLVMLLGLNFIFNFWEVLERERRLRVGRRPAGAAGSVLLGMAFGAGWTPCVGPILASILLLAGTSGRMLTGTLLLAAYSAGLGLPFLLAGLFFSRFSRQAQRLRPHLERIRVASGVFLIMIGLLIALGRLQRLNVALFGLAGALEAWQQSRPGLARLALSAALLLPAALLGRSAWRRVREGSPGPGGSAGEAALRVETRRLPLGRLALGLAFLAAAVLELAGALDLARLLASWFSFQGL